MPIEFTIVMNCYHERVFYYWRHGLYGHVRLLCEIAQSTKSNDLFLYVWTALAHGMEGDANSALRILKRMTGRTDLTLLYGISKYCVCKRAKNVKSEQLSEILMKVREHMKTANSFSLASSVQVAWMFDEMSLANEILAYVDTESFSMMPVLAWIKLTQGNYEGAFELFEKVLSDPNHSFDLLALYGKAVYHAAKKQNIDCTQTYARILSRYDFPELNIEKARANAMHGNWKMAASVASEVADKLPSPLEAEIICSFGNLVRGNDANRVVKSLDIIADLLNKYENKNWRLCLKISRAFGTLCCECLPIIDRTLRIAQTAVNADPENPSCLSILGYHEMMGQNYVIAENTLNRVLEKDPHNEFAIRNKLHLMLMTDRSDHVRDELELYSYLSDPKLSMLESAARYARMAGDYDTQILPLLGGLEKHVMTIDTEVCDTWHFTKLELQPERLLDLFIAMDVHEIIASLDELVVFNKSIRYAPHGNISERLESLFATIDRVLPGHVPLRFARACFYHLNGKFDDAETELDQMYISKWYYRLGTALALSANIWLEKGNITMSKSCLRDALNFDNTMGTNPVVQLVRLKIDPSKQNFGNLIKNLANPALCELLEFVDVCIDNKEWDIGFELLKMAASKAKTPNEKSELVVRQAFLVAGKGNIEKAFSLLDGLKKHTKYATSVAKTYSKIKLQILGDTEHFMDPLKELIEQERTTDHLLLLGDAYVSVLNFDKAAAVYAKAFDKEVINSVTLKKYVSALISGHRFDNAVTAFTSCVSSLKGTAYVPLYLIKELIRLKRYNDAKQCITHTNKLVNKSNPIMNADFLEQRGIVAFKLENIDEAENQFQAATEIYDSILSEDVVSSFAKYVKEKASSVYFQLGEVKVKQGRKDISVQLHTKSLELDPSNSAALISLVNYYKAKLDINQCVTLCSKYLNLHPHNETIALLLTSFEVRVYTESIRCLKRVLKAHPGFYRTLVRLIEICARAGKLSIAGKRVTNDQTPGMTFARGLLFMYTGRWSEASTCFHRVERDPRWGQPAKIGLFQLLVNPHRKYIWSEASPLSSESDLVEATKLLETVETSEVNKQIMLAEIESARNTDKSVQKSMHLFAKVLESSPGNIPALVGLARCSIRTEQVLQADRYIDRVLLSKPFHDTYPYFEEAYLMRAQINLKQNNYRAAQNFILLALDINMSSQKAWEMAAITHTHNHMFAEAANAYYHCWDLTGKKDPEIGYNFAQCALKANKPENALVMCRNVNEIIPYFKDMREKILMPAFRDLRP